MMKAGLENNPTVFLFSDTQVNIHYSKCSKILNSFLLLFSHQMLVFRAGYHKMLVRIANREDPDQTASSEAV